LLGTEKTDDDNKNEQYEKLIDKTEDDLTILELAVSELDKAIADYKDSVATSKPVLQTSKACMKTTSPRSGMMTQRQMQLKR